MIAFACTHCREQVSVRDQLAGLMGKCPQCGATLVFPFLSSDQYEAANSNTLPPPGSTPQPPQESTITVEVVEEEAEFVPPGPIADADPLLMLQASDGETQVRDDQQALVAGYDVLEEVGRGGMGVVYKARQLRLNRIVALKMILAGMHAGPQEIGRFRTEAESVASLKHPNIVQIYDVGEQEGRPYLALEFLDGGSLEHRLDGTPLAARKAAALIETLARAMHVAHQHGVVHRDLKPGNILFTSDGIPKITDFGLAKRLDSVTAQTQSGAIMGTPSYMAPEQAAGKVGSVGPHADIYALGAMLYELLTGRPPFRAESPLDTVMQVINEEPVRPRRLHSKVPVDLETICLKCLDKEPYRRYHSARALAEDVRRYQDGEPIRARQMNSFARVIHWTKRRPAVAGLLAAIAVAFIALIVGGVSLWYNARLQAALEETREAKRAEQYARLAEDEQRKRTAAALASNLYLNRIVLAEREWRSGNITRAGQLLEACVPAPGQADPRHWEWHYLKRLCHTEEQTIPVNREGVGQVACGPDGSLIASAGWDHRVCLWNARTGALVHSLPGHGSWVRRVAFRADGLQLASASDDRTIRTWDVATGKLLQSWVAHDGHVRALSWSRNSKWLASAGADKVVKIWDPDTGKLRFSLVGHSQAVESIAFTPDGQRLASGGEDRTLRVWDVALQKELFVIQAHSKTVTCITCDPDGERIASASMDRTVRIWNARTGQEIQTLLGHVSPVRSLAFNADGSRLASAGMTIRIWDPQSGNELYSLRGHASDILSIAFTPDSRRLVTGGADGSIKLWNGVESPELHRFLGHAKHVLMLTFSPDGTRLASASADGSVRMWDASSGKILHELRIHPTKSATSVAFSPDGKRLVSCSYGDATVWDTERGTQVFTLERAGSVAVFSPDGRILTTAGYDRSDAGLYVGFLQSWDAEKGTSIRRYETLPFLISGLTYNPDGSRIACTVQVERTDDMVLVYNTTSAATEWRIQVRTQNLDAVLFDPSGERVAAPSGGYSTPAEVKFWDLRTGEETLALRGHEGPIFGLAFSGDGLRAATVSSDKTLRLWDTTTGAELFSLRGDKDWGCVAFSPDGKRLAAAGSEGPIFVWSAEP